VYILCYVPLNFKYIVLSFTVCVSYFEICQSILQVPCDCITDELLCGHYQLGGW